MLNTTTDFNENEFNETETSFNNTPHTPKKKSGMKKRLGKMAASGTAFGLAAAIAFSGVVSLTGVTKSEDTKTVSTTTASSVSGGIKQTSVTNTTSSSSDTDGTASVSDIAKECLPSVVSITCTSVQEVQSMFGTQEYEGQSAGTGIIVGENDSELLIATNNHVVSGAEDVSVCFNDDKDEVVEASVKGTDSDNDLAVVSVSLDNLSDDILDSISIATLGDSDDMQVGDQVVAIGNALGYGQSVTSGYVSALNREVTTEESTAKLIQTDAAINPGNSGGALLNMKGEVIGINSSKYSDTSVEGMGYAIPINTAKTILDKLMTQTTKTKVEESKQGSLGIQCQEVTSDIASMYNLPEGVYVYGFADNSAAEDAGIKQGDVITAVEGQSVSSVTDLKNALSYYAEGDTVSVTVSRADNGTYKEQKISVKLGAALSTSDSSSTDGNSSDSSNSENGLGNYYGNSGSLFGNYSSGSAAQGTGAMSR